MAERKNLRIGDIVMVKRGGMPLLSEIGFGKVWFSDMPSSQVIVEFDGSNPAYVNPDSLDKLLESSTPFTVFEGGAREIWRNEA